MYKRQIDDSSTIKVNTEKGFSDITGGIIIVDTGDFGGLYYLDALNNRSLFFSVESREEFSALLTKYDLAQLVDVYKRQARWLSAAGWIIGMPALTGRKCSFINPCWP